MTTNSFPLSPPPSRESPDNSVQDVCIMCGPDNSICQDTGTRERQSKVPRHWFSKKNELPQMGLHSTLCILGGCSTSWATVAAQLAEFKSPIKSLPQYLNLYMCMWSIQCWEGQGQSRWSSSVDEVSSYYCLRMALHGSPGINYTPYLLTHTCTCKSGTFGSKERVLSSVHKWGVWRSKMCSVY